MMDHAHVVECVLYVNDLLAKKTIAEADYSRAELSDIVKADDISTKAGDLNARL